MEQLNIFSKSYWRAAAREYKNLRHLIFAALICAASVVVGAFLYIPVGENLRVKFTFFLTAVGGAVYGPLVALPMGAITDILAYIVHPTGAFFPGYTLSSMLSAVIFALFLYRKKITVLRLFGAKLLINYLVNVLLGSLWSMLFMGKAYVVYLVPSFFKNSILLPFEVLLTALLFLALIPAFSGRNLFVRHAPGDLEKLAFGQSAFLVFGLECLLGGAAGLYYGTIATKNAAVYPAAGGVLIGLGIALLLAAPIVRFVRRKKSEKQA